MVSDAIVFCSCAETLALMADTAKSNASSHPLIIVLNRVLMMPLNYKPDDDVDYPYT